MATKSPLNIVLGAGNIGDTTADKTARYGTPEEINAFLGAFSARGYTQLDTARAYSPNAPGTSELKLGMVEAGKKYVLDTKIGARTPGSHKKDAIEESIKISLELLKVPQVNIEYLHAPDRSTPFEETCEALDDAYRQGKFKHFGISNYSADEVNEIMEICERRGFVKPTVYQGQYNPIVRSPEEDLFPILRKHKIAFYAYSPGAGGFFAGNHKDVQPGGRFDTSSRIGGIYAQWYMQPAIEAATDRALEVATKHGISGHAAALRWTVHHSILSAEFGDSVIIGASSVAQLNDNLDMIEQGPLPKEVVDALGAVFKETSGTEIPYHR